jgi:hypothetical protein
VPSRLSGFGPASTRVLSTPTVGTATVIEMDPDIQSLDDLSPLAVDLEELADALEGDPLTSGGLLDLDTGEVWPQSVIDSLRESEGSEWEEKIEHWLYIDNLGSHAVYQDMCDFIETLADERLAEKLAIAVGGRGAFRRFKDVLSKHPALLEEFFAFTRSLKIQRAADWLAENGYRATGSSPGSE